MMYMKKKQFQLKYYNYDIVFQEIPNEVTLAINITNCPNRCKGCHSPHLQKNIGYILNEDVMVSLLEKYGSVITCVCFMGGDIAPNEVAELASFTQSHCPGIKTAWYSGCNSLPIGFSVKSFQYIKLGAYIEELGPINCETTNQRLLEVQPDGLMNDITSLLRANVYH